VPRREHRFFLDPIRVYSRAPGAAIGILELPIDEEAQEGGRPRVSG